MKNNFLTLNELKKKTWKKNSKTQDIIIDDNKNIKLNFYKNKIIYSNGKWIDVSNPNENPTTTNPLVSENITLKKRIEALTRTAAISFLEVEQLNKKIKEAEEILAQLENC